VAAERMNPRPETTEQEEDRVNIARMDDLKKILLAAARRCHHVDMEVIIGRLNWPYCRYFFKTI
jgi:hypothetical protein